MGWGGVVGARDLTKLNYFTTRDAANDSGLSVRTIQDKIKRREIKALRFGAMYLIEKSIWEEWKSRNIRAV